MFFSKLNAMSIGTVWVSRSQEKSQFAAHHSDFSTTDYCASCGEPWIQSAVEAATAIIVVTAESITNEVQQKLLENCLTMAGWGAQQTSFSLHASCSSDHQAALHVLQMQIAAQQPNLIIVFGHDAATLMETEHVEFIPGQIYQFANTQLIVTHHPQEMIDTPALKAQVWADLCSARSSQMSEDSD